MSARRYRAIVIGASAGGLGALERVLCGLPAGFSIPILIVQHLHPTDSSYFAQHLDSLSDLTVADAYDKEPVRPGRVYVAPANYHMLVEADETIALTVDAKVNYSRPSVDVLFDTAARVWGKRLLGVVLTGANEDGAEGSRTIKRLGGDVIA